MKRITSAPPGGIRYFWRWWYTYVIVSGQSSLFSNGVYCEWQCDFLVERYGRCQNNPPNGNLLT